MQGPTFSLDSGEVVTVLANRSRTKVSPSAAERKQPERAPWGQTAVDVRGRGLGVRGADRESRKDWNSLWWHCHVCRGREDRKWTSDISERSPSFSITPLVFTSF